MPVYDFFADNDLVRPDVSVDDAVAIGSSLFGITGTATELGSQQDRNFLIESNTDGAVQRFVLKIHNPAFSTAELHAQEEGLDFLAKRGMTVPLYVPGIDGQIRQSWNAAGTSLPVRLLTFLDGPSLQSQGFLAPDVIRALGSLSATAAVNLADFSGDGLDRLLQWDMRQAEAVIAQLEHWVVDEERRDAIHAFTASASQRLSPLMPSLRVQVIHGDITDDNVICAVAPSGHRIPVGLIDFGDLALGWLVAELAVTVSSVLPHAPENPFAALEAIVAFDDILPLSDEEISALWPLVTLRGAVLAVSGAQQLSVDEGNDYANDRMQAEWDLFVSASSVGWDEAEAAIRHALGRPHRRENTRGSSATVLGSIVAMIPGLTSETAEILDFSVTSPLLSGGAWLGEGIEELLATDALTRQPFAVAAYGQSRLTRTARLSRDEPESFPLVTEVFLAPGTALVAPLDAVVAVIDDDLVVLHTSAGEIRVGGISSGLVVGSEITAGTVLGTTRARATENARVRLQLLTFENMDAPPFVGKSRTAGWIHLTKDPAVLLGLTPTKADLSPEKEQERRADVMAGAQEKYYEQPPQIERGWQELLIDTTGRAYVDMVNNVTSIGHAHPRFTQAISDQLQLVNTNNRFLYKALADLSERIVEVSPDPSLDTVLLVNSGSEAVDLALHLAKLHTRRTGIVALREGYHGWTEASDAVSTSAFDNPFAVASRPSGIHIADIPNTYRGKYTGPDAAKRYAEDVTTLLDSADGPGENLAAFISEPVIGNAGGVVPPEGYLANVYEQVRARGGLCIADEVQVGYGRLGAHFWGVQQQGVVPDIMTMAKAMGNGYPLGAVITRRDIAESLAREGNFFSSAGGSPVSCVAGLTVLNVIRDEGLQANAKAVGERLASRLAELASRHEIIGAVHGMGLYMGIELVRNRETQEPAIEETTAICERLLALGVIMQPTSERQNVLKIKPPMCLSLASANFFVDALDEVLTAGW
ncbi:aminotransferase [Alpinimonas psychrophila]|uniref:4-aminobutyrate aminotransferase-like enzyme/Ser/Thr protein kinase RdoA (MazF antagonist) n=1 Tax=Alpinimonas psychrophila TaxID=748908 RepID=A0A7W3JTD1_9MICO|nr:4-aminobutyrate aminotransferase-like enzyme/Ser/Thr protein kinase RdoA (MazF antagonist) [Alpinimonas psychrophila]